MKPLDLDIIKLLVVDNLKKSRSDVECYWSTSILKKFAFFIFSSL